MLYYLWSVEHITELIFHMKGSCIMRITYLTPRQKTTISRLLHSCLSEFSDKLINVLPQEQRTDFVSYASDVILANVYVIVNSHEYKGTSSEPIVKKITAAHPASPTKNRSMTFFLSFVVEKGAITFTDLTWSIK